MAETKLTVGSKVRKTTGLKTFGMEGVIVKLAPYAKGTLATVRRRGFETYFEADVRELEEI